MSPLSQTEFSICTPNITAFKDNFWSYLHNVTSRYPDPVDRIYNRVISDISVVLRENTLTISDSIKTGLLVETEVVRVVSLTTTDITEITRVKKKSILRVWIPKIIDKMVFYTAFNGISVYITATAHIIHVFPGFTSTRLGLLSVLPRDSNVI